MTWLEAAAAFAVVMMVFSTLSTIAVDTLYRILRVRERGLKQLIEITYKDVIQPHIKQTVSFESANRFAKKLSEVRGTKLRHNANPIAKSLNFFSRKITNGSEDTSLSTTDFIERLAQTDEGQSILKQAKQKGEQHLSTVVEDIAAKYEAFGNNASKYFKRHSTLTSFAIGLVLAFSLNINVVHLFNTLLQDPTLRVELIEKSEAVSSNMKDIEDRLEKLNNSDSEAENDIETIKANINLPCWCKRSNRS